MLLTQLDMPSARYVCYANEGFISYRIDAQRQYIEFERLGFPEAKNALWGFAAEREHSESTELTYRQKKKQEQE
jgi:hypothetical protein